MWITALFYVVLPNALKVERKNIGNALIVLFQDGPINQSAGGSRVKQDLVHGANGFTCIN